MFWAIFTAFGGMMQGSFAFPMRFTKKWQWENTWTMWSFWTLIVLPWSFAYATIPNLIGLYKEVEPCVLIFICAMGVLWGFGAICTGVGIDLLGMGMGFSLVVGLVLSIGSILPLLTTGQDLMAKSSLVLIAGVATMLVGITINAIAACKRENDINNGNDEINGKNTKKLIAGIAVCLIAGVASPMLNMAFVKGEVLREMAVEAGASFTNSPNTIWPIALSGGFISNFIYCAFLINKNKTLANFTAKGTKIYYLYTLIMGMLWGGGIVIYGMGTANLGELGPSVGWAIFFGLAIAWANVLGVISGEWKSAHKNTFITMLFGLFLLIIGIGLVGWANTL